MKPFRRWSAVVPMLLVLAGAGCTGASENGDVEPAGSADPQLASSPHWDALRDLNLSKEAEAFGVDVPDAAEFIEYIHPDDFGRVRSQCMREQGFDARETFDGGVSYGRIPDDQSEAQRSAAVLCSARYPVHPRFLEPLTEEQVRVIYDYYVDELVACLQREGYDPGEVPSWETYRDTRGTEDDWTPYHALVGDVMSRPDDWQAINEACPQSPPLEALHR
jgi:hypothetical protein